jgi:hypothetical protein
MACEGKVVFRLRCFNSCVISQLNWLDKLRRVAIKCECHSRAGIVVTHTVTLAIEYIHHYYHDYEADHGKESKCRIIVQRR